MDVVIRIFKSWGSRDPERRWVNNYEAHGEAAQSPNDFKPMMDIIVAAEKTIHLATVQFLSATISTWEPDSHPYDPTTFWTYELAGIGAGGAVGDDAALDSNVAFLVKRQTNGGRSGKLFYRGCLTEGDVHMAGDARFQLESTSVHLETGNAFVAYKAAMAPIMSPQVISPAPFLALISKIGVNQVARPVTGLRVGGVTISRRNHRYFDRH